VIPAVALVLLGALQGCEGGSGLDDISITVQGAVTDEAQAPVEGVWVHLLAGPPMSPEPVTADRTDASGAYSIGTQVPPEDCNDLRLAVLATQTFSASATPLASSLLGSCGDLRVDLVVTGQP
jgi:hypothetical protein